MLFPPKFMCLYPAIDVWLCGQAQNGANLDCQVKFDLEGQDRPLHKTIGNLTNVFCIFDPNVVNLVWMGYELSRGQASDWHTPRQTDRQTDRQADTHTHTQSTAIPEDQNWPRIKRVPMPWRHHGHANHTWTKQRPHLALDRIGIMDSQIRVEN